LPLTMVPVTEKETAQKISAFIETLEDNDDVQDVYTNVDFDDAVLKELETEDS
jgi:transcriptional/translational regulatory protein YebC/TACO1